MTKIKGKQIATSTITQSNIGITTASVVNATDVTTKEYVDNLTASAITSIDFGTSNLNMTALTTVPTGYKLACNTGLAITPNSIVKVLINGAEVNVGVGLDCVFSPDGSTLRVPGTEILGDKLYWNTDDAPYQLDGQDEIDFEYLTSNM